MNREQLKEIYRQQIAKMLQNRMRADETEVIPLRMGVLIFNGNNHVNEDDFDDSSYTGEEEENTGDEDESEDSSMTVEDEEEIPTEVYSDSSDFEWLVDLMVQGQKEDEKEEENNKDIKSVERIEKKPKKLAKK